MVIFMKEWERLIMVQDMNHMVKEHISIKELASLLKLIGNIEEAQILKQLKLSIDPKENHLLSFKLMLEKSIATLPI